MATNQNYKARILKASAGSGKTFSLACEYIYNTLRNQPGQSDEDFNPNIYRTILAVTFTNKATEEMKTRILTQINNLATGEPCEFLTILLEKTALPEPVLRKRAMMVRSAILHDYSRFSILTNDTFFQRIVRAFAKELNIDMDYAIELDTAPLVQRGVDMLIEQVEKDASLQQWLESFAEENIEIGSQWNIKRVLLSLKDELFGEQARNAIDREIDKAQLEKMVTDYTEAAQKFVDEYVNIGTRALQMISDAGYCHQTFTRGFTKHFEKIARSKRKLEGPSNPFLDHQNDDLSEWFTKGRKGDAGAYELASQLQPLVARVVDEYEKVKYLNNSISLLSRNYRSFALMYDLYKKVAEICKDQNTMLLAQTKHTIAQFVREPSDAPFIYEKVGNVFDKFMIDEFQDTSLMEWQNFLPMLRNAISQSEDVAVLLVGDIKQSIYRFRGSDWNILGVKAPVELSEGCSEVMQSNLEDNYRSQPNLVRFNNVAISLATRRLNNSLNGMLTQALKKSHITNELYSELYNAVGDAYRWPLLKQNAKRKPHRTGYVSVTAHREKEPDIVGLIRTLVYEKGYKPCDITILVRRKEHASKIASLLLEAGAQDESMRFGIMTQEALKINSSVVVMFALAVMKYAVDRKDTVSLAMYNKFCHNFDLYHTPTAEEIAFFDHIRMLSPEQAYMQIMVRYPEQFKGQTVYADAFHEQIVKFCANKVADLSLFVSWWGEKGGEKSVSVDKDVNAIEIMTIHKSKGLENKVVIIPYCTWSLNESLSKPSTIWTQPMKSDKLDTDIHFPVVANSTARDSIFSEGYYRDMVYNYVDSINLLYVAFTRPKEQLHIFFPAPMSNEKEDKDTTVGHLIYKALGMKPKCNENGEVDTTSDIVYQYGTFDSVINPTEAEQGTVEFDDCTMSPFKMSLKLSSSRFIEACKGGAISPRQEGIVLHGIMERATTREDIDRAIKQLSDNMVIDGAEANELLEQIDAMFSNPMVEEWFSDIWDEVYTESAIITKGAKTKRPDRVMVAADRAVVVDYKFGEQNMGNRVQVAQYAKLLKAMGYSNIEGYVWYVREGVIDKVL